MSVTETYEKGKAVMRQLLGDDYVEKAEKGIAAGEFGLFPAEHAMEACFGTIWARPQLDMRSRSLTTIAMVIGVGDPFGLKNHVRGALRLGISHEEIAEVAYQAIPYLGYPLAGVAIRAMREVFADEGLL
jgi:4-carboxymuconolactone decarboxylase